MTFQDFLNLHPSMNTCERECAKLAFDWALEGAAKLAYAEALTFEGSSVRSRPSAALKLLAHKLRAMQTTAGAAGGEGK